MDVDECQVRGHVKDDPDDWCCAECDADQCPDCLAWFPDYDAFLVHAGVHG